MEEVRLLPRPDMIARRAAEAENVMLDSAQMERWRRNGLDAGLLLFRVGLGSMMLVHGWPKLATFGERAATFPDPLGVGSTTSLALAVLGEVFCSALLVLGAGTRLSAVPFAITMAVAGFVVHAGDPWNDREKAFFYLLGGLVLVLTGAGRFSVDGLVAARRAKARAPAGAA